MTTPTPSKSWAEANPGGLFGSVFRGWIQPTLVIALTPPLAVLFWLWATEFDGSVLAFIQQFSVQGLLDLWPSPSWWAVGVIAAWTAVQWLLLVVVPGKKALGPVTPAGEQPPYTLNGVACWAITHVAVVGGTMMGWIRPALIYDRFGEILWTSILLSLVICALLYVKGRVAPTGKDTSVSANPIWDYWNGVELHPRLFGVELKQLINCRVSMMGWSVLLLCWAHKQIELTGSLHWAMGVSVGLQVVYLFKFFWWEDGYFRSLDITHDRFGYYLFWGLMAWVPSLYTLATMCLVERTTDISPAVAIAIAIFGLASIAVNYAADRQRQVVRATNGDTTVFGKPPVLIEASYTTEDGEERTSILLASGYWAISRHFNYIAELALAAAWTLPAGFGLLLPWSYVIFLTILLTDRARRDDVRCANKYGADWEKYTAVAKWKMIPGVW